MAQTNPIPPFFPKSLSSISHSLNPDSNTPFLKLLKFEILQSLLHLHSKFEFVTCIALTSSRFSSINQSSRMEEYGDETNHQLPPKERDQTSSSISILQGLNTIIQLHFEKTLEKKRAVDAQKKYIWKLFHLFFILLSLILLTLSHSHSHSKLQCRHCWIPITFLTLSHLIFYISVAHTLRCINGFKYQRRCHKLTLCLATEKLRQLKARIVMKQTQGLEIDDEDVVGEFEIPYQEPDESYFAKFKRNWAMHFGFILFVYAFMVASSVVLLC